MHIDNIEKVISAVLLKVKALPELSDLLTLLGSERVLLHKCEILSIVNTCDFQLLLSGGLLCKDPFEF